MRFVDSNVFLYSFLKAKKSLTPKERQIKNEARKIVKSVEDGERVSTTTSHLSEILNIIETGIGLKESLAFLAWAVSSENLILHPVTEQDYARALPLANRHQISANDALAIHTMRRNNIAQIYTFDRHFEHLEGLTKLPKLR